MNAPADIRFNDGACYETYMGEWSLLVGRRFLVWLAPPAAAQWVDVGCGNGAFTELLFERCAPSRDRVELLQARLRARLVPSPDGRTTCSGRANAIRGRRTQRG